MSAAPVTQSYYRDLYLPLVWRSVTIGDLSGPVAVTLTPSSTPLPTGTKTPTPTITPTPTATEIIPTGRIHGKMTTEGEPLAAGFGLPGFPQIELRRQVAGEWETVANTVTHDGGVFEFVDPPPLAPGETYQVWWMNDIDAGLGADLWVHRWWSKKIAAFGDGTDVDVGTFELADLRYKFPCHDCHRSLPITYEWFPRDHDTEVYQWRLFKDCGNLEDRPNAYRTQSLGYIDEYTLSSPPPGFVYDTTYCWYIWIDDGANGTGWPFHAWRTAFLSLPPPLDLIQGEYALLLTRGLVGR
jgi:hypothetical protein